MESTKIFRNREEAGKLLGEELQKYRFETPIVLAITRGGVETGYHIALKLECEFTVVVARKLGYLKQPEAAFGAIAEDGTLYLNPWARKMISQEEIYEVMDREKKEIDRRVQAYRKGEPLISLRGRTVIVADDGIATGSTLFAVVELCKKQKAAKIVIAAPVCSKEMLGELASRADEVVVLTTPEPYYAVSQVYEEFPGLSDQDVNRFINLWKARSDLKESLSKLL